MWKQARTQSHSVSGTESPKGSTNKVETNSVTITVALFVVVRGTHSLMRQPHERETAMNAEREESRQHEDDDDAVRPIDAADAIHQLLHDLDEHDLLNVDIDKIDTGCDESASGHKAWFTVEMANGQMFTVTVTEA